MIRISLNVKSQGNEKIEVFTEGTDCSKNLKRETLYISDYQYVNFSCFSVLQYVSPDLDHF